MQNDENQGVDIICPYHGQYKLVRDLIGSVILFTRHVPYRITLVDDGSPNADFFYALARLDTIDGVRLDKQQGFGAAINAGIKATKRPWIVLLNSDVVIDEVNWLESMHESLIKLNKSDKVGLVSARSDNPPGNHPILKSPKEKRVDIGNQVSKEPLPLFCALMARAMYEKVGPFKEYPYGLYEDEEYFWRMKKRGYNQGICGTAWVKHLGGATVKELIDQDPEVKEIMESNRLKCLADLKILFGRK